MPAPASTIKSQIMQRIAQAPPSMVWTPADFLDLANRDAVDKTLQRMVSSNIHCVALIGACMTYDAPTRSLGSPTRQTTPESSML